MAVDQSVWGYFIHAGPVVKTVMLALLFASIASWTLIFQRRQLFKQARQAMAKFENVFWSGTNLGNLYTAMEQREQSLSGMEAIFHAGFKEYTKLRQRRSDENAVTAMEGAQRAMRVAQSRELERIEQNLPFLATVGSVSPYVGLFGTVWGIMTAFHALGSVQQATIAMVAPGISEALVATAMGLFAAIPAVIAYNRFSSQADVLANNFESFQEEFASILYRQSGHEDGAN